LHEVEHMAKRVKRLEEAIREAVKSKRGFEAA
jgi:hypothetical protein